jgi:lysophospholipase L1-like esterase
LNPKVFWLLIGTNDLGVSWCSPEATLIGILRVVEEIRQQRPGTLVVVNGLLPRSLDRKNGFLYHSSNIPMWNAIREVNAQLKAYCDHKKGVVYVDSTDLFLVDPTVPEKRLQIDRNLMNDFLHPSYIGYKIWGDSIIEKLNELI